MLDKTTIFAYDNGGNITSRVEYKYSLADTSNLENGYTFNYEYASQGWRDQLLSYNGAICGEYDNLGNPSVYRGKRLSWSHGRQLDSIGDITYKYNSNGVRIAKTANGVTTKFYLDGAAILAQEVGNRLMLFTRGVDGLNGFTLDGAEYFYKKNIQGDIIAIMGSTGAEIVRYVYDAWGNHKTYVLANGEYKQMSEAQNSAYAEVAQLNPYRYRSYYYDVETGLYYLNSRYYDSEVGRFINADNVSEAEPDDINGLNLYAYCLDNPVMYIDTMGTSFKSFFRGIGNWFKNTWQKVKEGFKKAVNWVKEKVGVVVNTVETFVQNSVDYIIGGFEQIIQYTDVNFGSNKLITFFVSAPKDWWKFWEYEIGVEININDFHLSHSISLKEGKLSIGYGDTTVHLFAGISKIGMGVSHKIGNVQMTRNYYIRTLTLALALVGFAIGVPIAAVA